MKKIIISLTFVFFLNTVHSQQTKVDSVISLFQLAIKNNPIQFVDDYKTEFTKLDSNIQASVLNYLYTYNQEPLLYLNINKLHQALEVYYESNYAQIRIRTTNLILETYRLTQGTTSIGWVWYKKAKASDFNEDAKVKIMRIIKCEPFSKAELNLLYKYELNLLKKSYSNDTLRIREYRKKSNLPLNELRDSVAATIAEDNMKNLKPSKYLDGLGIYYLASWLYINEAIPYIEKAMAIDYQEMGKYYKLPLARLGNQKYEAELLDSMYKTNHFDYRVIGFLRTPNALNAIIESLKLKGRPKGKIPAQNKEGKWVEVEMEGEPYNCYYLRGLILSNLIPELPFKFDGLLLATCEIPEVDIEQVIKWLEQNRGSIVLNRDYH